MFYILVIRSHLWVWFNFNTLGTKPYGVCYIPCKYFGCMESLSPCLWSCVSKWQMPCKLCTQISVKNKVLFGCDMI